MASEEAPPPPPPPPHSYWVSTAKPEGEPWLTAADIQAFMDKCKADMANPKPHVHLISGPAWENGGGRCMECGAWVDTHDR